MNIECYKQDQSWIAERLSSPFLKRGALDIAIHNQLSNHLELSTNFLQIVSCIMIFYLSCWQYVSMPWWSIYMRPQWFNGHSLAPSLVPLVFTHHHPSPYSSLSTSSSSSPYSSYSSPFPLFSATRRIDIAQLSCGPAIQHVARYPENKIRFFQMDQFSFHIPYGGNYTLILRTFSSVS